MKTKPARALTMRDRMSHLSFESACKLLGPQGKRLLLEGGALELETPGDMTLDEREVSVVWDKSDPARRAIVRLVLDPSSRAHLRASCSACGGACLHIGGLLAHVLENKSALGLAEPPAESELAIDGDERTIVDAALAERAERAATERMQVRPEDATRPWADYAVTNLLSGKTYRVALRGETRGVSYCSCPDFKKNTLGTCKHVMKVLAWARKRFPRSTLRKPYVRKRVTVHLRYEGSVSLALALPAKMTNGARDVVMSLDSPLDVHALLHALPKLEAAGQAFFVTPDAEEFIERALVQERLAGIAAEVRADAKKHPLRTSLLATPLLPYQLDGIAFAAGAGRAILADDMGLGKTIQGIGVAELLAREANVRKVLVVCPTSLKSQWRSEIRRFSRRSVEIVSGTAKDRPLTYAGDAFFTICNYEQVLRDIAHIERARWDLVILDEGQRIKNWEAKTSRVVKGLASRFALVLSGTPLENRLDDLHSVVEFVDPHALGPQFRFFHRHRRVDGDGKLVGYKNLDELRESLRPILLRRTRESVRLELPERTTEIVRIAPSAQQKDIHDAQMRVVAKIVRKPYLTEMDLLRLRASLLMCRMAANATFLVDKIAPGTSTKLERLDGLIEEIVSEPDRKVVLFSEWTTMLDLIEPLLRKRRLDFVRLDGSVPQKQRAEIVARFQSDPRARFFLTTNAGSTGLNLQAANTIVNVDLPWNPAVLEQRIARAHRMGQARPVNVYVLVTEDTLEENLLGTLSAKRDLALAALDPDSNVSEVDVRTGAEDLKRRLEILLGAKPEAPIDRVAQEGGAAPPPLAETGKALVRAAVSFLDQLARSGAAGGALDAKIEVDALGQRRLSLAVPSEERIEAIAQGLLDLLTGLAGPRASEATSGTRSAPAPVGPVRRGDSSRAPRTTPAPPA
jgi:superfamily II DNA or RNA helicase